MEHISIKSIAELDSAAIQFLEKIGDNKIFAFKGEMGAGKTTFIKAICQKMGVIENITSPTFSLVNEYITNNNTYIYHFDCYRLKNIEEAYDIGVEDYFYSNSYCFIEWPEKIEELLPSETITVSIEVINKNEREVTLTT